MICKQCEKDFSQKDFYKSDICYKCLYKNKISTFSKYVSRFKLCRICKGKIPPEKDKFCSPECAKKGKEIQDKEYWIRKCYSPKINWKN